MANEEQPSSSASNPNQSDVSRNRRRIFSWCLALVVIGVSVFFLGRFLGWFGPSPESVLRETFELANEGKYNAATKNLASGVRRALENDLDYMTETWDFLTRGRTIQELRVNHGHWTGKYHFLTFTIRYKDGEKLQATTAFGNEDGPWTFTLQDVYEKATKEFGQSWLQKRFPVSLQPNWTSVKDTSVSIRLPGGCHYDEDKEEFLHPRHGIYVCVQERKLQNYSQLLYYANKNFGKSNTKLSKTEELPDPRFKKAFKEGGYINAKKAQWAFMTLVIGDERKAVLVIAGCPEPYRELTRQSILSTKWAP